MADDDKLYDEVSEQRRELMMAIALDNDRALAYELQMQEKRNASLALEPSSSSRPSSQPNWENLPSPKDDSFEMAKALWLEELESLRPVAEDGERSEAEVTKVVEDRSSQKRAKYTHNMSEGERMVNGDNYQRPYRSSSPDGKHCRLYVKGLLSEENVGDKNVKLAGAGIAICDSKDGLLWEESKTLEVQVDGQVVINEVAELMALIEGLNQVRALHLNRVKFFCDDDEVYRIIQAAGGKEPQQSRIATLVNEVALLQRQFTYCKSSLVTPNDMKYAYKFARDAIVSQVTRLEEANDDKQLKETCVICVENTDVDKMFSVDGCLHRYCHSCMKKHVEVKLLAGMEAKCPHEGCNSKVSIDSCGKFLAPELGEALNQKMKESSIPVT